VERGQYNIGLVPPAPGCNRAGDTHRYVSQCCSWSQILQWCGEWLQEADYMCTYSYKSLGRTRRQRFTTHTKDTYVLWQIAIDPVKHVLRFGHHVLEPNERKGQHTESSPFFQPLIIGLPILREITLRHACTPLSVRAQRCQLT